MTCKFCEDYQPYIDEDDENLLEVLINKQRQCLEVHFSNRLTVLDYENISIKYCPFCGTKLTHQPNSQNKEES